MTCKSCNGDGYTAEHNPNDPHENGCSYCPIQVQCEFCRGTGKLPTPKPAPNKLKEIK